MNREPSNRWNVTRERIQSEVEWIAETHAHYLEVMTDFAAHMPSANFDRAAMPHIKIERFAHKWAGMYYPCAGGIHGVTECVYCLPYVFVEGREAYAKTIAHEVCHHFNSLLMANASAHGDLFLYMLRKVCGFDYAGRCHDYSVAGCEECAADIEAVVATGSVVDRQRGGLSALRQKYEIKRKV